MSLQKSFIFFWLTFILNYETTFSQPVACNDTFIVENEKPAVISCEYANTFIAVFWYQGESQNPFLRLEEQRPTTVEGFNITKSGDMVIENVQVKNEGSYRISVLDQDGVSNSGTVQIQVKVILEQQPLLQSCTSPQLDSCQENNEDKQDNVLICQTFGTRPAVQLEWSKLSAGEHVVVNELQSNSLLNSSTGLFTSNSVLQLDKKSFSLQYFTCKALGIAVVDAKEATIFMEGDENVEIVSEPSNLVHIGSTFNAQCSNRKNDLSIWKFTHPNSTVITLKKSFPGEESGHCQHVPRCNVQRDGSLTIDDVTHKDEGSYQCLHSNGEMSGRSITYLHVLISPTPDKINIEGCKEINDCTKNVASTGKLQATILEARPFVEIICEVDAASESMAFLFNHQSNSQEFSGKGTSNTIYTVEYDIKPCSEHVHVVCKVSPDSVHEATPPSHVYLVTDTSRCGKGKPGLVVFLLMLIIVLIITVAAVVVLCRRKKSVRKGFVKYFPIKRGQPEKNDLKDDMKNEPKTGGEEAEVKVKIGVEEGNISDEDNHANESEQTLLPEETELDSKFIAFCKNVEKTERVQQVPFEVLLKMFQSDDTTRPAGIVLIERITSTNVHKKVLGIVLKHLAGLTPHEWVPILDFCKKLEDVTDTNKLPPGDYMTILVKLVNDSKINITTYVDMTGNSIRSGKTDDTSVLSNLHKLFSQKKINQDEFIESILKYLQSYKMEKDTILQDIQDLNKEPCKVPYPLFLRWIHKLHHERTCDPLLYDLFYDVLSKCLSQNYRTLIPKNDNTEEHFTSIYIQAIFYTACYKKTYIETCFDILKSDHDSVQITPTDVKGVYKKFQKNEKLNPQEQREVLNLYLRLLKKMLSVAGFKEEILQMINSKQEDKTFWITWTVNAWKEKSITPEVKEKFVLTIANTYLVTREEFKRDVENTGLTVDQRRVFLKQIKFVDAVVIAKLKSEEKIKKESKAGSKPT